MTTETRDFDLADILSVTTELLLSHRHVDGLYDLMGFMTGESLFTHQLPRACEPCSNELLKQMPWLAELRPPRDVSKADLFGWLTRMEQEHGMRHQVIGRCVGWERRDPIAELDQIAGPRPVVVVRVDGRSD